MRTALGGCRFLLTIGISVLDMMLLLVGRISEGSYVTLTLSTVAAFIAAHTADRFGNFNDHPPIRGDHHD